jgi:hypothetical protein
LGTIDRAPTSAQSGKQSMKKENAHEYEIC